ncbi:MAG TPA: sialate O-acetylesterase [Chitinophagaceae bacterium]|jgi:sialate O-acetylesterase|nr:sialate O-acetylesterase [Chitinophagaceae bacterium]
MRSLISSILFLFSLQVSANITLPSFFSDGVVLQRNTSINIWGWADAGEKVKIVFNNKTYQTLAAKNGEWKIKLAPQKAGGPYEMKISGNNELLIKDILIGDVWIASGQSNMEYEMGNVRNLYKDDIASSDNNFIRQFAVKKEYSFTPLKDVTSAYGGWKAANPENVLSFSAVAYFFARDLYAKYKVPIGIINTTWGGTPAEAWTSKEALKAFPNYFDRYEYISQPQHIKAIKARVDSVRKVYEKKIEDYLIKDTTGFSCTDINYNANDWKQMKLPALWEAAGLPNYDGLVWFRKEMNIPDELANKEAVLELSYIDDIDNTYINGKLVGSGMIWNQARKYIIPAGILKAGKNVIAVKVIDTGGGGGVYGEGKLQLSIGDKIFPLNVDWQYKVFAQAPLPPYRWNGGILNLHYEPTALYNAMLAPSIPYNIKGVIWYQGEANSNRAKEYQRLFPNMIADWRKHFAQGNFPFLFVQLANYNELAKDADWPALREAQLKTLKLSPNTGMAVTIDIGEAGDIHPKNKKDVGLRLSLAAQKIAYKDNVVYSGPIYQSYKIEGNKIIIYFTNTSGDLVSNGGDLKYFEIAGADKKFVAANAEIKGNTVIVWSDAVAYPVAVRYAWSNSPDGCNLYNKEGLPASPFRTSDW